MLDPIQTYAERHTAPEPPLLAQLTRETHLQTLLPRMSSGHVQGRFLSLLSHLVRPRRVLEIGAFCGYATLCLAEGLAADGVLHTIEIDPEREARIRRYVAAAGVAERVRVHIGAALDVLAGLVEEEWDLVFIDADKRNNDAHFEAFIGQVRPGGLLIVHDAYINAEKTGPLHVAEYSALLMNITEGKCYSLAEMRVYLDGAGFEWMEYQPTAVARGYILARRI